MEMQVSYFPKPKELKTEAARKKTKKPFLLSNSQEERYFIVL